MLIMPLIMNGRFAEVDYSTFLRAIEENRVQQVEMSADTQEIRYVAVDNNGRLQSYVTVAMPDPNLLERLSSSENEIRFLGSNQPSPHPS